MPFPAQALLAAASTLQQISDRTPGERGRRASVVALVLRAIERVVEDPGEVKFLLRLAEEKIEELDSRRERAILKGVLEAVLGGRSGAIPELLNAYAAELEEAHRVPEAEAVVELARSGAPGRADLALRAARLARLQGQRERALKLYGVARELDGGDGSIARLAAIGEAVVAEDPGPALSRAVRGAIRAGDGEAAAVALEERARARRSKGDRRGAARDFAAAAVRFGDPVDRARVTHQLADLYVAGDDPRAAREVLLFTLETGDRSQRDHAKARLHTVCRDLGDQLGMRRWRSFERPALVSFSSRPDRAVDASAAPSVARWREHVEARFASVAKRA